MDATAAEIKVCCKSENFWRSPESVTPEVRPGIKAAAKGILYVVERKMSSKAKFASVGEQRSRAKR